ncbi:hypothetical protein TCAL_05719 [Tigriopus californicus]|uniref:UNC93-like protein n=3 Tax=Tigriopus californicus TaxID=6832 RepID=A0A553N7S3_TIGCA|nr:hypothetical protein TCAL_05719 [Tigriopus californicus]
MSHSNAGFEPDSKDMNSNVGRKGSIVQGETVIHRQDLTEEEVKRESFKMKKNVVIISFAFMLLFTAFQSMANLQSSINKVNGLGTYSLSVIYGALVLSCMFLPSVIIKTISVKWTMVFSMFCYSTYIAAQFYPSFGTLIPGAIILGLGAAPMWSAKCTYLTQVGNKYAEVTGVQVEPIIVRFFGIFFLFFQFASVWGSLISSWVLSSGDEVAQISREELQYCGVNYCPKAAPLPSINTTLNVEPDLEDNFATSKTKLYTLAGIYLACSLVSATVVALFVDPLSRYGEHERDDGREKLSGLQLLVATFQHMTKPYQILVIPLTFWSGIEQGFFGADFTAGFVSCAYGVQNVGYVVIAYGVSDAVCSFSFGFLIKKVGRVPIFLFGTLVNIVVIVVFFTWSPNPEEQYVFYILAALWGVADAVWQTQINALYGVLFEKDEEAAFSNYRLWESLGFIVAYILQNNVCIYSKLWVMIGVLSTGMIGYLIIEAMEFRKRRGDLNPDIEPSSFERTLASSTENHLCTSTVQSVTMEATRSEKRAIMRNVIIISVGFMVLFTSYSSVTALQSSINKTDGIGSFSLAATYLFLVLSTLFLSNIIIDKINTKWAMIFSMACYSTYIAAQFYATFWTLIPTASLVGIAAAPLWIAKCSYLSEAGKRYSQLSGQSVDAVVGRFFGIFFLLFQCASIWGNIASSLRTPDKEEPTQDGSTTSPSSSAKEQKLNKTRENFALLFATVKHMSQKEQLLLIPITIWSGLEQGFFGADFSAGFISCAFGVDKIGYIFIIYGITDAIGSFVFGYVIKYVGRISIFCLGGLINLVAIGFMFSWTPNPDQSHVFYIIAAFWGAADAVWQTQINALYGSLFAANKDAGFSNYRLWESVGFLAAFALQTQLCIGSKLGILGGFLGLGLAGYFVVEYIQYIKSKCQVVPEK